MFCVAMNGFSGLLIVVSGHGAISVLMLFGGLGLILPLRFFSCFILLSGPSTLVFLCECVLNVGFGKSGMLLRKERRPHLSAVYQ